MSKSMMFSNNKKQNRSSLSLAIILIAAVFVGTTLAFFFATDWASKSIEMSGKVDILAVGDGNVSIEDNNTISKLIITLDNGYDKLIPGMPIEMPVSVRVTRSTTKPLIRARVTMKILDRETMTEQSDELAAIQNMYGQMLDIIESNDWHLHTDGYFYYVSGVTQTGEGGNTILAEVDATAKNEVLPFIDDKITFPTWITHAYSGLAVQYKITFQAIQNYIPDENGRQLPNTITNSLKIFNEFPDSEVYEPTSVEDFEITYSGDEVIINKKSGVSYPETLKLPQYDSAGKQITTVSASIGQIAAKNIVVPAGYTTITEGMFKNNTTIESIDLSQTSITEIPYEFCSGATNLETVGTPNTLEIIGGSAFMNTSLSSIILPEGLEQINANAFNMTQITSIYIPSTVNVVSDESFLYSYQLRTIVVSDKNENYYDLESSAFVRSSDDLLYLFAPCADYSRFNIASSVKKIAEKAFYNNENIRTISFPASITNLDTNVFYNCPNLQSVIFEGTTPPTFTSSTLHSGTTNNTFVIYVPDAAVNAYKAVANLSAYKDRILPMSEHPDN